jgi:molybdopterin biosynthesis enzyme
VLEAEPLPWTGSSDMVGLATADGLLALPAGGRRHEPGEHVEVLRLDREPA